MLPGYCFYNGAVYSYNERNNPQTAEAWTKEQNLKIASFKGADGDAILTKMSGSYQILPLTIAFSQQQSATNAGCEGYIGPVPNSPIISGQEA